MGRFELNLALARIADLEANEKRSAHPSVGSQKCGVNNIERAGIVLGQNFRPTAMRFKPKDPPANFVMDKIHARRALDDAQAWIAAQQINDRLTPQARLTENQKAIAFFAALMAIGAVLDRAGVSLSRGHRVVQALRYPGGSRMDTTRTMMRCARRASTTRRRRTRDGATNVKRGDSPRSATGVGRGFGLHRPARRRGQSGPWKTS